MARDALKLDFCPLDALASLLAAPHEGDALRVLLAMLLACDADGVCRATNASIAETAIPEQLRKAGSSISERSINRAKSALVVSGILEPIHTHGGRVAGHRVKLPIASSMRAATAVQHGAPSRLEHILRADSHQTRTSHDPNPPNEQPPHTLFLSSDKIGYVAIIGDLGFEGDKTGDIYTSPNLATYPPSTSPLLATYPAKTGDHLANTGDLATDPDKTGDIDKGSTPPIHSQFKNPSSSSNLLTTKTGATSSFERPATTGGGGGGQKAVGDEKTLTRKRREELAKQLRTKAIERAGIAWKKNVERILAIENPRVTSRMIDGAVREAKEKKLRVADGWATYAASLLESVANRERFNASEAKRRDEIAKAKARALPVLAAGKVAKQQQAPAVAARVRSTDELRDAIIAAIHKYAGSSASMRLNRAMNMAFVPAPETLQSLAQQLRDGAGTHKELVVFASLASGFVSEFFTDEVRFVQDEAAKEIAT